MKIVKPILLAVTLCALQARGADLKKFGDEMAYFYLAPTKERFDAFQLKADRLYNDLQKTGSGAETLAAVFIAKASMKHHWEIAGNGKVSGVAKEIVQASSNFAKYVNDDRKVDLHKLDIWWSSFFATGDTAYLKKILQQAKLPQPGERAADFMMPAMAAWSFKSNCKQHKAVAAFAKNCLENNLLPTKKEFLKDCVAFAGQKGAAGDQYGVVPRGDP
jgi:hypothetical protein